MKYHYLINLTVDDFETWMAKTTGAPMTTVKLYDIAGKEKEMYSAQRAVVTNVILLSVYDDNDVPVWPVLASPATFSGEVDV